MALTRTVAWSSAGALAAILALEGWEMIPTPEIRLAIRVALGVVVLLSVVRDVLVVARSEPRWRAAVHRLPETSLLLPILLLPDRPAAWALSVFLRQFIVLVRMAAATERYRRFAMSLQLRPAMTLVLSFAIIITVGTVLLSFPRATTDGTGAGFVDALFTSTSATCVTGLATLDTVPVSDAPAFTIFGQFVILGLIQVGGLGIMTLSAASVVLSGRRLSFRSTTMLQEVLDERSSSALQSAIRSILALTFISEAVGAVALYPSFLEVSADPLEAWWRSVFHAVSAFCNAGFDVFGDSLQGFHDDLWVNGVHAVLIVVGGLGFATVTALAHRRTWRHGPGGTWRNLPLQVRIVLAFSALLLFVGAVAYYFFEFDHSLAGMDLGEKLLASAFQSVTFRTAGFSTVDMGSISRSMIIVGILLMFIGGSPGSTAGGVKTTTVAVLIMNVRAALLGRGSVEVGRRTIPPGVVTRAVSIVAIAGGLLVISLVLLLATQPHIPFDHLLFESVSALGTVGLSMGATSSLTPVGKLIVVWMMFVGRLGPLTVALAIGQRRASEKFHTYQYPEARVVVG
ncbi:MAG: TrkH family potassium uptake protein [Myxococcota bacterium]